MVVVEEGLALAHEDEVDAGGAVVTAGAGELDVVAVEDGGDLAGDLARGEVAADAEFGGKAELAVDGAADLRRDADGGAAEGASLPAAGVARVVIDAVAVGHPDGLDSFTVGKLDEVALSAVDGAGGSGEDGEADGVGLGEGGTEFGGEGRHLVKRGDALAIEGVEELAGAERFLAEGSHKLGELDRARGRRAAPQWKVLTSQASVYRCQAGSEAMRFEPAHGAGAGRLFSCAAVKELRLKEFHGNFNDAQCSVYG